jgi:hypothetical protein
MWILTRFASLSLSLFFSRVLLPPRFHQAHSLFNVLYQQQQENLTDHFAENYKKWGCTLEFVTNRSQEGSQFCRGFGGIGGILRWKLDFSEIEAAEEMDELGF